MTARGGVLHKPLAIKSILQYRFATPNPLKARPRPGGLQNRSFVQFDRAPPWGDSTITDSPLWAGCFCVIFVWRAWENDGELCLTKNPV